MLTPGKQCQVMDLPLPLCCAAAEVLEGTPAFCGGLSSRGGSQQDCYKFDKTNITWPKVFLSIEKISRPPNLRTPRLTIERPRPVLPKNFI